MASKKRTPENNLVIIIPIDTPLSIPKMYSNIEKYALEAKLQDFENSVNNEIFVCQPA